MGGADGAKGEWVVDDGPEEVDALHEGMASGWGWYESSVIRCVQAGERGLHAAVLGCMLLQAFQGSTQRG